MFGLWLIRWSDKQEEVWFLCVSERTILSSDIGRADRPHALHRTRSHSELHAKVELTRLWLRPGLFLAVWDTTRLTVVQFAIITSDRARPNT